VGTLNLGTKQNGEDFTGGDLEIFEEAAGHAAQAMRTITLQGEYVEKKRMERDLDVARNIQKQLLPQEIPEMEGLQLFGESRSCFEVAGDYFDLIPIGENRLLLVIADVSGKGAGAALIMANLQASLRLAVKLGHPLREIVCEINNLIHQNTSSAQFITFFLGDLDVGRGELQYINAGHNPPVVVHSDGELQHLSTTGMVLGVQEDRDYELRSISLSHGDVLTLYTDGYSEAFNPVGEEFGEERLIETIVENRCGSPDEIARALREELLRFTEGKPLDDDLTIVIAKIG
jgi:sigma-B regulation protein RsbU (phosphoserine phosphatase)